MATASTMPIPMPLGRLGLGAEEHIDTHRLLWSSEVALCVVAIGSSDVGERRVTLLESLPGEIIIEIFKMLDFYGTFALSSTSRRLRRIYLDNKSHIILAILPTEFGPMEGLLRAASASPSDLNTIWGTWLDKEIRFKGRVLCTGKELPITSLVEPSMDDSMQSRERIPHPLVVKHLEDPEIDRLIELCKLVKGWENIFPRYRWVHSPERVRGLTDTEKERLRGALYTWIRYDYYFHGQLPRPNHLIPANIDPRCNHVRVLSSGQQAELEDLWKTVRDMTRSLCPCLKTVRNGMEATLSEEEAAQIAWGADNHENNLIVATMMKLGPEKLLYYVSRQHEYPKSRLIREIRQQQPGFESDVESLSMALGVVYWERLRACVQQSLPVPLQPRPKGDEPFGGIIDWSYLFEPLRHVVPAGFGLKWTLDEDEVEDETREMPVGALEL